MKVRTDFSNVNASIGRSSFSPTSQAQAGKVFGVVTTKNTPTEKQFNRAGGFNGIGTIFYLDYNRTKNIQGNVDDDFLDTCQMAIPLSSQIQYYPVLNELVYLIDLPSAASQISNTNGLKYYVNSINVWNNPQANAQLASNNDILGSTFVENPQIKSLLSFEGDHIIQGRQGNAIRFSTTSTSLRGLSEWSSIGKNNDPITVITNGFSYVKDEKFHVEKVNKDLSSIYLTSYQKIPLKPDRTGVLNPLTNPVSVSNYFNPQVILNSDRIVINSKRDEVMIFAKTNIEINTKNIININAGFRTHLNSNKVLLGSLNSNNDAQPILMSYNVLAALMKIQATLTELAGYLNPTTATKEGASVPNLNLAGTALLEDMTDLLTILNPEEIFSKKVYIAQ